MYLIKLRHCSLIVIISLLSTVVSGQPQRDMQALGSGKPIERELAGGEAHVYTIQLTTGQFLEVIVDQRGIDVVVFLFGPDGQKLDEVDSASGVEGPEAVSALVQSTGLHRVEVRALEKGASPGRYEIKTAANALFVSGKSRGRPENPPRS